MTTWKALPLSIAVSCCIAGSALAEDAKLSGFLRAAGALTTGDSKYLERIDKNGDTGDTHFGVNVSKDLSDKVSVAGQLFASGTESGEYGVVLDWAYATVRAAQGVSLNLGKIKYPNLLVSEYVDIGIAYPWMRPPQELYSTDVAGRPNLAMESFVGGSAIYDGFAGNFEYSAQVYAGEAPVGMTGKLSKLMGAKFKTNTDIFTLQAAYSTHMPENTVGEGGLPAEKNGKSVSVVSAGAMMDWADILVMTEYVSGKVADESPLDTTAMYGTLGYKLGAWMPNVTYSMLDTEGGQTALGFGVKYQVNAAATFKIDLQQVTPDATPGETADAFNVIGAAFDIVF